MNIEPTLAKSRKLDRFLTREITKMKLSAVADRIRATKERLDKEADALASRLDEIDTVAPKAFDRAHVFLDHQKAEVGTIEDTLRQLSNLPLDSSSSGSDDASS
jgi:acetoin utilization deacetylase AcuC-like enzyme